MTRPTLPPGYEQLPQADREARLLAWAREVYAAVEDRNGDDWVLIGESLFHLRACTSLSDQDATARANTVPSGTRHGWTLCADVPVPCADKPDTHRHLTWEC